MIVIKFRLCCDNCENKKVYVTDEKIYGDNTIQVIKTTIGCEHEEVCKEFREGAPK